MRSNGPRRIALGLTLLVLAGPVACSPAAETQRDARAAQIQLPTDQPNVLVIMTDDQPVNNTMTMMPITRRWFDRGGTTFSSAFATTPLCCPSRASIFTGQYVHNHGVQTNRRDSAEALDQSSTMQRYLSEAGYRNGIFGKFLNGWDVNQDPPFFHDWAVIGGGKAKAYYGGQWNVDGETRTVDEYSTNFIRERGLRFLESTEEEDSRPWMLFLNVYAPHQPALVPPRFEDVEVPRWRMNPARRESDFSDKPDFGQRKDDAANSARPIYRNQMRSLVPVDRMVGSVMSRLRALGEVRNTLAFFVSDNGYLLGEHGLLRKSSAYAPSIKIPLLARWPGHFESNVRDRRIVANIDIAPTVYEAARVTTDSAYPVEGMSLLGTESRRDILLEYWPEAEGRRHVPWASLRTKRYQYIEYYGADLERVRFREYYNLRSDWWQLANVLRDRNPANDPNLGRIKRRLERLRDCSGDSCRP